MDLNKLAQDIAKIVKHLDKKTFIYDLLLAYDFPKATITRLQKGTLNKVQKTSEQSNGMNAKSTPKKPWQNSTTPIRCPKV